MFCVTVENVAFHKESFINNRRQLKRHVQNQWIRGQSARAVDGIASNNIQHCAILDNFYVENPHLDGGPGRDCHCVGRHHHDLDWQKER